jgi:hypothetical protein
LAVTQDEPLVKFVRQSNEYRKKPLSYKETSLTPKTAPFVKSVFRTSRMTDAEVGNAEDRVMVGAARSKPRGRLILTKSDVETSCSGHSCLRVEIEESDHRWHCDIHWPDGIGPEAKALRTNLSQQLLAKNVILELTPD